METSEADLPPTENAPFRVPTIGEAVEAADADDREEGIEGLDEIKDSMCMVCGGNGTTRMLTTKIPFFREIILSSFECDECQWTNNEVSKSVSRDALDCMWPFRNLQRRVVLTFRCIELECSGWTRVLRYTASQTMVFHQACDVLPRGRVQ